MAFPEPCAERPVIDDIASCHGAARHASPAMAEAAARLAGRPFTAFRRVALLECGTGVGLAVLAASLAGTGADVTGTTPDPKEAAAARALLEEAGLHADVRLTPTEELAPEAFPEVDLVLMPEGWDRLHGNGRLGLARLLRERLSPGGGFMVMREAPPGARGPQLLRRLVANRFAALGGDALTGRARTEAAKRAISSAAAMLPICHAALRTQPRWRAELERMSRLPGALAERDWLAPRGPVWSMREFQPWLEEADLASWAPADPERLLRSLDFTPDQLELIDETADPGAAAETEELISGVGQRCDLFLRPGGAPSRLSDQRLRPLTHAFEPSLEVHGFLGTSRLARDHHAPALRAISEIASASSDGSATLGDVADLLSMAVESLRDPVCALIGAGALAPAPSAPAPADARAACLRLNRLLMSRIESGWAASPATGGPVALKSGRGNAAALATDRPRTSAERLAEMKNLGVPI